MIAVKENILKAYLKYKVSNDNNWDDSRKSDLEIYNLRWNIVKNKFDFNIHDRYIKTDKVEIILSSGFLNLSNTAKDFTYIVKANNETR